MKDCFAIVRNKIELQDMNSQLRQKNQNCEILVSLLYLAILTLFLTIASSYLAILTILS